MNTCKPMALGLAIGILWSVCVGGIGLTTMWFGWGSGLIPPLATLYIGYHASYVGALVGAIWAFGDGFVGGYVVAWLYNRLA